MSLDSSGFRPVPIRYDPGLASWGQPGARSGGEWALSTRYGPSLGRDGKASGVTADGTPSRGSGWSPGRPLRELVPPRNFRVVPIHRSGGSRGAAPDSTRRSIGVSPARRGSCGACGCGRVPRIANRITATTLFLRRPAGPGPVEQDCWRWLRVVPGCLWRLAGQTGSRVELPRAQS